MKRQPPITTRTHPLFPYTTLFRSSRLSNPPLVVPVLRAGLGMLGGILRYLPETDTGFIGLARNEETYLPASYMNSVPEELGGRPVLVLDPILATRVPLQPHCPPLVDRGAGGPSAGSGLAAPTGVAPT